ncbi:phage/plasmid primase, P4 family [Clostridium neonatale]|uniref:phage/plasmid primase, P4 family n=1 Tax=Clostridium neonatale TaxID=137838 RepID=UPI00291BFDDD|nr:putative DNA primase/helicase [Clostridium neonatale]
MDKDNYISLVDRGLTPIVPLFDYKKVPVIKWNDKDNWITTKEYDFKQYSNKNITGFSLVCGKPSGIMVIDIDLNHGETNGQESFNKLIEDLSEEDKEQILNTYTINTPNGGKHLYFQYEKGLKSKANYVTSVDIRTDGGLIVLQGSQVKIDNEIREYKVLNDTNINKMPKSLFDKFMKIIAPKTKNDKKSSNNGQVSNYKEGSRNQELFKEVIGIISKSSIRDINTISSIARGLNLLKCSPPLEDEEVNNIITSISQRLNPQYCNEKGIVNNYLLSEHILQNQPCYTKGNLWFMYDESKGVYEYLELKQVQRMYFKYAINDNDKSPTKSKNFAELLMLLSEDAKEVYDEKRYINCLNGIVDIERNVLIKHTSEYKTEVQFQANLITNKEEWKELFDKSEFKKFLYSTLDEESIKTIQEAWGLMLSPHAKEVQNCFIYKGEGSNGKSAIFDIQEALINDNRHICSIGLGDFGETFAISVAEGKHVNIVRDDELNGKTVSKAFKSMCCGEPVTVNRKNKDLVRLGFNMTMFFGLNRMPSASDKSTGFFRRPIIIPFNISFGTEKEVEEGIRDKIKDPLISKRIIDNELDIVFTWAYAGLHRVKKNNWKVTQSQASIDEMEEYRQESDSAYAFFKEKVIKISKEGIKIPIKDVYNSYYNWCTDNHIVPMNNKHFGRQLSSFGIKSKVSNSIRYYLDIEIDDLEPVPEQEYIFKK